ncbi:MAG: hypothetical protein WCG21_11890 [Eubacteriales bacterium]
MVTETLQVNILAKIRDFEKKMGVVEKKIDTVGKGSKTASKTIDKMLSTKSSGTHKAVDLVNKKLAQVNRTAASTKKALSGKMMFSADSSGIDLQKVKLDQLKQKYEDLTSGVRAPTSLKTAEKDLAAVSQQLTDADAKAAKLYTELQRLQTLQSGSRDIGNTKGVARYQEQIDAVQREMDALAASTDNAGAKAISLNAKIEALRMNPSASPEARLLAAQIQAADAKMEKLGTDTTSTTKKVSGLRSGGGALDAINRKISNLERSSAKTARSVTALGRRFLVLFTGKLISMAFNGLQDGLTGAATKSDDLQNSLNTLSSAGRTISNAVVAALTPLINVAAPMIDYISQKIMDFGNSVAMFFAAISGQDTVLQATKAYAGFGAAAEGAGDSAAAGAEKARNALAGFDQITKLDTSTSSFGSGGTGTKTAEGATSYVSVPVVQSDLAKKVSGAIEKLKGPLSDFYENVLRPIGAWVMGTGVDILATGLESIANFFEDHPQLIDNLALFLATIVPLSALGPVAVVLGITVQATIASIEWYGGVDVSKLFMDAFSGKMKKDWDASGATIGGWFVDAIQHGFIQDDTWTDGSYGDQLEQLMMKAFNTDTAYGAGVWKEIGTNMGIGIMNGLIDFINWSSGPIEVMINQMRDMFGQDPISLTIAPIDYVAYYDNMKAAEAETQRRTRAMEGFFDGMPTSVQSAMTHTGTTVKTGTRDQSRTYQDYLYGLTSGTKTSYGVMTATVDLGTKDAARYMNNNIGTGVIGVTGAFGGMPSTIQAHLATLDATVKTGATNAHASLTGKTAEGVNTALGSYSGMPSAVQAHMNSLKDNVYVGSLAARNALYDNTNSGVNDASGSLGRFSNDGTTKLGTFAENVRDLMETVLRNMARLPSNATEARGFSGLTSGFLEGIHRLPMFAQGGVVNSATAAIIGENGKEAVMPLERNTGWIDKLADKINSRGGGGGDIYLTVQNVMDGRVISEQVTKLQKRDARRSNKPVWGNA